MDLFEHAHQKRLEQEAPLAARMRPRTLDEYVGQEHIIGPGRLLRRAIQADQLGSLIFYGPPGTGKTTLARVIANTTRAHFIALNAVLSGVKDIREAVADAQERAKHYSQGTILFVDEVHRFNKAQQDALLPWVENGTVIFIGATTENPYFEVNKALVSRSRIFQLQPLTGQHLHAIIRQALADASRGYGDLAIVLDRAAADHLVDVANGDARAVLNALELAVETTSPTPLDTLRGDLADWAATVQSPLVDLPSTQEAIHVTLAIAEESIQHRAVLYDKEGDYHFDTISAFIKSLRGSDPDAALYWMAKMIYAGESPRFLFRRMFIFAGEDVGMADPLAVQVVAACAQSFEWVGLPEGRFPLAQAALYLATAPKSNSTFALFDALETVEREADSGVPNHLRDGNRDKEGFGHGEGYLYPHAYRDHWVAQQYLPTSLQGKIFYQPSDQGYEAGIADQVARRREAQLAAMLEAGDGDVVEMLTYSPDDPAKDRWLQRTISSSGQRLGDLRDRVLDHARLARHSLVLDLKTASGLLTWEALRRVPEGGVYTLARSVRDADALTQLTARLADVEQPIILQGEIVDLPMLLADQAGMRFDALIGYNAFLDQADKAGQAAVLARLLSPTGVISLAERVPRHTQRLHKLVDLDGLAVDLRTRMIQAEEAIYADAADPLVSWDEETLAQALRAAGLTVTATGVTESNDLKITDALLQRWFAPAMGDKPSYGQRLAVALSPEEVQQVQDLFVRQLRNQVVTWHSRLVYFTATTATMRASTASM